MIQGGIFEGERARYPALNKVWKHMQFPFQGNDPANTGFYDSSWPALSTWGPTGQDLQDVVPGLANRENISWYVGIGKHNMPI